MSIFMSGASRGQDQPAALAEADAGAARTLATGAEDHLVAVLKERARLVVRKRDRLAAPQPGLERAAPALVLRAGAGAGRLEIADLEIAAVAGVMRHHLRHRPVDRRERSMAQSERLFARSAHLLGCEQDLERDVDPAARLVGGVGEMRQRR